MTDDRETRLDDLIADRHATLERLRAQGVDPYPVGVVVTDSLAGVRDRFDGRLEPAQETGETVAVAGRLVLRRGHGHSARVPAGPRGGTDGSGHLRLSSAAGVDG
ncbi:MAG: hypothetical protein WD250_01545 [Egibacteraceae bacterium]